MDAICTKPLQVQFLSTIALIDFIATLLIRRLCQWMRCARSRQYAYLCRENKTGDVDLVLGHEYFVVVENR